MPTPAETERAATRREKILDSLETCSREGRRFPFTRELAKTHKVSDRTIRKDLELLETLGTIERDGSPGGIRLLRPTPA